jgi:hypothetical protein
MMKKTVSLEMNPVQIVIDAPKGASEKEILKLAEAEAIKQLQAKLPAYKFSITNGTSMSLEDCEPGRIVRFNEGVGYIFEVKSNRKFQVSIALSGGRKVNVKPVGIEAVDDESLLGTVWNERPDFMKEMGEWAMGDNAYIPVGKEVKKIVIGKVTKSLIHAYELSTEYKGKYYPLKPTHFHFLCDTEEKAKAFLSK